MIRRLELRCGFCAQEFLADKVLHYKDDFIEKDISKLKLMCDACKKKWEEEYVVHTAEFCEKDCFLYMDVAFRNGTVHKMLDCTALEDRIVAGIDLPETAQKELFSIYEVWLNEKRKDLVKECIFSEEHMKTTFSCVTFSGETFNDIAFRFNRKGELETEVPVPANIMAQVVEAWHMCEITGKNRFVRE